MLKFKSFLSFIFIVLVTSSCNSLADTPSLNEFKSKFDSRLNWLNESTLKRPFYLFPFSSPLHRVSLSLEPVFRNYDNLPEHVDSESAELFRNHYVVFDSSKKVAYFSSSLDFADAFPIGLGSETVPNVQWYFVDADESSVTFQYGFMYINAWISDALLLMSDVIDRERYRQLSRDILWAMAKDINSDGKFYRRFNRGSDTPGYYNGMSQGILMRAFHNYLKREDDQAILGAFCHMAEGYKHTAEGVWNHWTNSIIAGIMRDEAFGTQEVNTSSIHNWVKNTLGGYIRQFDGKIPKEMKRTAPNFPTFSATYQTYDVNLLMLFDEYLSHSSGFTDDLFKKTFKKAKVKNYGSFFGNNTNTLWLMAKNRDQRDNVFAKQQLSLLDASSSNAQHVVGYMVGAASLANYYHNFGNVSERQISCR